MLNCKPVFLEERRGNRMSAPVISNNTKKLGWKPKINFNSLVSEMVQEDLSAAQRDELTKKHGYRTPDFNE